MARPSLSGSGRTPQITLRLPEAERDDGRWAAEALGTTVSERLRAEHSALVAEAERVTGEVRPSQRNA